MDEDILNKQWAISKQQTACPLDPEDESMFLRRFFKLLPDYMASHTEHSSSHSHRCENHKSNLSLFPVAATLEHRASVKRFVSLHFPNPRTVGRIPCTGDQPVARPLPTQTHNKRRRTSMSWVGFEPTISAFERVKTVKSSTVLYYSVIMKIVSMMET
jgi:hypothetical protein